jgi:hypothetical protein
VKVHQRDTELYDRVMAHLQKHKDSELAFEDLFSKLEEELKEHKDIYEELLLIMDVKKFSKYSQTLMSSTRENKKSFRVGHKQMTGYSNNNNNHNENFSNSNNNNSGNILREESIRDNANFNTNNNKIQNFGSDYRRRIGFDDEKSKFFIFLLQNLNFIIVTFDFFYLKLFNFFYVYTCFTYVLEEQNELDLIEEDSNYNNTNTNTNTNTNNNKYFKNNNHHYQITSNIKDAKIKSK